MISIYLSIFIKKNFFLEIDIYFKRVFLKIDFFFFFFEIYRYVCMHACIYIKKKMDSPRVKTSTIY